MDLVQRAKEFLGLRQQAYQQVFDPENIYVQSVLRDLAKFCRANDTAFHTDDRLHAVLEGRREVFLRIQKHLKFTPEQLAEYYKLKE